MKLALDIRPVPAWRRVLPWIASAGLLGMLAWLLAGLLGDLQVERVLVVNETDCSRLPVDARCPHAELAELRHLADVRLGEPLWRVDLERAVEGVLRHPWVREAEARRRWPDAVELRVREHLPVMLVLLDGLYYVDEQGEVFKRARADDLDYPVLTGLEGSLGEDGALARRVVAAALDVLAAVRESPALDVERLSELRLDPLDGFTLVLRDGSELDLGFADPRACLERLRRLQAVGALDGGPRRVDLVSEDLALVVPLDGASRRAGP